MSTFADDAQPAACSAQVHTLLAEVQREWRGFRHGGRVVGAWVRLLDGVTIEQASSSAHLTQPPQRVWFLDHHSGALARRGIDSYLRFAAVAPPRLFDLGLATLAPIDDSPDWYLDYQWHGRYGAGWRYALDGRTAAVSSRTQLWLS